MNQKNKICNISVVESTESPVQWKVGWGYTGKCNMACPFCYSKSTRENPFASKQTLVQSLDFVRENSGSIESINWGTGENALDEEWWELITTIHDVAPHILQGVTTNGYLGEVCKESVSHKNIFLHCVDDIDVSLDFAQRDHHNNMRGNSKAYGWVMETLSLCNENNKPCSVVMLGCEETLSIPNIDRLFYFASEHACSVRINVLRPTRGVRMHPPSYHTVKDALIHMVQNYGVVSLADPLFAGLFGQEAKDASGISSLRILPDGKITPSTYLIESPWIACHIADSGVLRLDQLSHMSPFTNIADDQFPEACENCPIVERCRGGAKDRRILWYGTLFERDPYCPTRYGEESKWGTIESICMVTPEGPFIHDGYLPTVIFHPAKKNAGKKEEL